MAEDDTARRDGALGIDMSSASDDAKSPGWPVWSTREGDSGSTWPVYDAEADRRDGIDDVDPPPPRRPWGDLIAVVITSLVVAAIGVGVVRSRDRPAAESPTDVSAPKPFVPDGPQWTRVASSLTAGLVRVQVTATVEADGLVMTTDGLIATSYARLVGLNGSAASIDAIELNVIADGGMAMRAEIVGFDLSRDVAVLRVPGYTPSSVAKLGTPVRKGDLLTLLDDQGGDQPITGYPVAVSATKQPCSRIGAAMISRPRGFQFSLDLATAEPGGAVVRADGSVVGLYYGGDNNPHCAVPIADVAAVVHNVALGKQTSTTRVGPPGGLDIQLYGPDDTYPTITSIVSSGGLADKAGLQVDDVLTRVGNTSLRRQDLTTLGPDGVIRTLEPGRKVTIEWQSGGVTHRASVGVGVGPQPHG